MRSGRLTVLAIVLLTSLHIAANAQKVADLPSPPPVDNKTSLVIENIDVVFQGVPTYRLTVRNLSEKDVIAIQFNILQNGKKQSGGLQQGMEDRPLIAPGEVYQAEIPSVTRATESADAQTIVLATAVFNDGTYQGDKGPAASLSAVEVGRKAAISQLVPIFKETLSASDLDSPEAMTRFKQTVSDISDSIDEIELKKLTRKYSDQNGSLKVAAQGALHLLRKSFLTEFEKFAAAQNGSDQKNAFRDWLENADRTYRAWYSRL